MKIGFSLILILIFLTACPKKEILEHKPVLTSYMINTCEFGHKRYFLLITPSEQDMDSIRIQNSQGKTVKIFDLDLEPDSCPTYWDMSHRMMSIPKKIKGYDYSYVFGGQGALIYQNPYCSRQENLADMDSFPCRFMVFEIDVDTSTADLNIWRSMDSIGWYRDSVPWRKIRLNDICTQEEVEEQKKFNQTLYERYTKVEINPNPFMEEFTFKLGNDFMGYSFAGKTITLKFMDDKGRVYLEKNIEAGKEYTFSLPDFPKGKVVYYTITWEDFRLSGQFMKSL